MTLQKSRATDALQRIMTSFKHFEKKLDKLQEDVNYHGHTLSELRVMVANLSAGTMMTPDINIDSLKRPVNNTAVQYDERYHMEEPKKSKIRNNIKGFSSKITNKSYQNQNKKYGITPFTEVPYRITKIPSNQKTITKQYPRHRKGDILRKGPSLRSQMSMEKKLFKIVTNA